MKSVSFRFAILASVFLGICTSAHAQIGVSNLTVLSIRATAPAASEAGDVGRLLVSRGDRTNGDLLVWLQIGGTAQNSVDYQTLSNVVLIPNGARGTEIVVTPIDDSIPEPTETVIVRLTMPPVASPVASYSISSTSGATVTIADNDHFVESNRPPVVAIATPQAGSRFAVGSKITLAAEAHDADGSVASVEFFSNDQSLGLGGRSAAGSPVNTPGIISSNIWLLMWSNAPAGEFTLTAKATDNLGAMTTSAGVRILVASNTIPTPTNKEPVTVGIVATDPFASEGLVMWCSNAVIGVNAQAGNVLWRTNCPNILGTNNAAFTVRRTGSTDAALRVYYAIGGTASNGVDYESLPGVVTIPAGGRSAEIVIRPIDDNIIEKLETVVLKLRQPPTPLDPADVAYTIGRPESAAAFIVDNDTPAPSPRILPDGMFNACELLTNGCFRVEISPNLVNWEIICTNAVADGMARHIDVEAAANPHRFYRFVPVPCPAE